jgi:uncharacterized protein involved in outer membrane biogenesis
MRKWFKRLIKLFLGLAFLLGLGTIAVVSFIDPNQFKEKIEQIVMVETDQVLTIGGPLAWRLYPSLSLEIHDITFNNTTTFKGALFSAKTAAIECSLWSVFSGKALLNLKLQDFNIALQKNANGITNWDSLTQKLNAKKTTEASPHSSYVSVLINGLKIKNGTISFKNMQDNSNYEIQQLDLTAEHLFQNVIGLSHPLSISFQIKNNAKTLSTISFKSDWSLDQTLNAIYLKDIKLFLTLPELNPVVLSGETTIHYAPDKPFRIAGNFASDKLAFGKLELTKFKTTLSFQENILDLSPLTFQMANATQNIRLKVNLKNKTPQYHLNHSTDNLDLGMLTASFVPDKKIDGSVNVTLDLSSKGSSQAELLSNLSGQTEVNVKNGKLYGIDLIVLLKNAEKTVHDLLGAITSKQAVNSDAVLNTTQSQWNTTAKNAYTPFDTLKMNAEIHQGTATHSTLSITHSEYNINGNGTIQLTNQTLQYQASVLLKSNLYPASDTVGSYLATVPIPVRIEGSLSDPKIRPDMKAYFNTSFQYAQKSLVKQTINNAVQNTLNKFLKTGL